jgi:hypothetical protein
LFIYVFYILFYFLPTPIPPPPPLDAQPKSEAKTEGKQSVNSLEKTTKKLKGLVKTPPKKESGSDHVSSLVKLQQQ